MQDAIPSISDRPAARLLPRRDLTIAFVDVVGFSALMAGDEDGTFDRWRALREDVVLPLLSERGGRLVALTGDGIFATFDDAPSALRWGEEVQRRARGARAGLAMRIALNHCRVLLDDGDPVGHGVNVAARLQERAVPGGVIFTRAVYDATRTDPAITCRRLGPMLLKNIAAPVEAFELVTDGRALAAARPDGADRPSLAVLPLRNVGGNAADDYFAEGLLEDVTTALASLRDLFVVSRQSTLAVADQDIAAIDVGRALRVRYVLGGTLQRAGTRLRARFRLTDAMDGGTISHERAEFGEDEVFAVQDSLVERVVARIVPQVRATELARARRKPPENFTAYDCYLRGLDGVLRPDRESFREGYAYFERAMALDPGFAMAFAWAARCHTMGKGMGHAISAADRLRAAELAQQAIRLDRDNALALATYAHVRAYLFADYETASDYLSRARAVGPNCVVSWLMSSATSSYVGEADLAVEQAERAVRLSPFDPQLYAAFHFLGMAHFVAGRFDEAVVWMRRSSAERPNHNSNLKLLAATLVGLGEVAEARAVARRVLELEPGFRLSQWIRGRPFRSDATSDLTKGLLREAGIPD